MTIFYLISTEYMKECEPIRVYCINCGTPMASPYDGFGNKLKDEFYCGKCGKVYCKSLDGFEWGNRKFIELKRHGE
jgi:hypothetical protein